MNTRLFLYTVLTVLCSVTLMGYSFGQVTDSIHPTSPIPFKSITTNGLSNFSPEKRKRWINMDRVTVETFNIALTPVEEELARAESIEIRALVERDTAVLKTIWMRDFTLDEPHNTVHRDRNPLPQYLSLHRRIEKLTLVDDHAYVTGIEYAVHVSPDGKVNTLYTRNYSHMWVKKLFDWKLATKGYE
jgi:hypothetical protein